MQFEFPCFDPVAIDLPWAIDIRWYGLCYVAGFVIAQLVLTRLARRRFLPVDADGAADLLFWCIIGVLVGGRLGYALFYDQSQLHPANVLRIWKGGMSFHGGLIGVFVAFVWFAVKRRANWRRLGDGVAIAVTPGIFLVRCANFVNGELFGRVAEPGTFGAMRFPTDPDALHALGLVGIDDVRSRELAIQYACGERTWEDVLPRLATHREVGSGSLERIDWEALRPKLDWEAAQQFVPFRHPSQLYEGLCEGLLLGLVLFALLWLTRRRPFGPGAYGGVFLIGYGVARSLLELLRQPDAQFTSSDDPVGTVFIGLTMGQTLSSLMVLAGLFFVATARRTPSTDAPASA
jgi:phosphatidylglycerol:prolipoprotein diacylglycerol transferase